MSQDRGVPEPEREKPIALIFNADNSELFSVGVCGDSVHNVEPRICIYTRGRHADVSSKIEMASNTARTIADLLNAAADAMDRSQADIRMATLPRTAER